MQMILDNLNISFWLLNLKLLIKKHFVDLKVLVAYSNSTNHMYKNIKDYKPHRKFKTFWNETSMGFLRQFARQELFWFSTRVKKHRWFKLEETFSGFLIHSARQDLYGFSLRVNHLWFKLEKKPLFVYYCFTSLGDPGIFW